MFYVYDFNLFLKEIVKTYVKYAFYVTEALTIYELHIFFFFEFKETSISGKAASKTSAVRSQTLCHDMFFLKTRERSVRNLWIILKKRKFTIITKVV